MEFWFLISFVLVVNHRHLKGFWFLVCWWEEDSGPDRRRLRSWLGMVPAEMIWLTASVGLCALQQGKDALPASQGPGTWRCTRKTGCQSSGLSIRRAETPDLGKLFWLHCFHLQKEGFGTKEKCSEFAYSGPLQSSVCFNWFRASQAVSHLICREGSQSDLSQVTKLLDQLSRWEPRPWPLQPSSVHAACNVRSSPGVKGMGQLSWRLLAGHHCLHRTPEIPALLLPALPSSPLPHFLKDQPSPESQSSVRSPTNKSSWELWSHAQMHLRDPRLSRWWEHIWPCLEVFPHTAWGSRSLLTWNPSSVVVTTPCWNSVQGMGPGDVQLLNPFFKQDL